MNLHGSSIRTTLQLGSAILGFLLYPASAQQHTPPPAAWMNSSLSPDDRAALVVKEMTLDEKISLLHGTGMVGLSPMSPLSVKSNGGAGYVVGVPRVGIPHIQIFDAAYGGGRSGGKRGASPAFPSHIAGGAKREPRADAAK